MKSKTKVLILSSMAQQEAMVREGEALRINYDFAGTTEQASSLLQHHHYDLVVAVSDERLIDVAAVLQMITSHHSATKVLILTDHPDETELFDLLQRGFTGLLQHGQKHHSTDGIVTSANGDNGCSGVTCHFDGMLGRSEPMQRVYEVIRNVARADVNVMITGESGTGKELVARSIHKRSRRSSEAFVPINCSAFPENLFEAELFGYEKGAFTGAAQRKIGLLEYAHKGTFFLDEVCEMPVSLQAKLLRVLQDRQLRHLGGNELIPVDVRLISASNRQLESALLENRLRQDFYFRLNVVNIHLPPLRERKEDISLLAYHFLEKFLHATDKDILGFDDEVLDAFERYEWPGNVRELENVVERAITLATENVIIPADLPPNIHPTAKRRHHSGPNMTLIEAKQRAVDEIERKYLLSLLLKYHGNITNLARESGMSRRNVHRLLKRHRLDPEQWRKRY